MTSEYREQREYNETLHAVGKKLFGLKRYSVNILLAAGTFLLAEHALKQQGQLRLILGITAAITALGALLLRVAFEWERVPVMRLGRFRKTAGPGLFIMIPLIDTIVGYIDCRITVTDFSAEKVLTRDAVPVYVDAIIFWMVWDAAKAKFEVEHYEHAVPLAAKTALRDSIGKNNLSRLLTDRDGVGKQLQKILDHKTNPWGITSLAVEIKDIVVPQGLEDAISKEAQAEREKNARIILGKAEVEIAQHFAEASQSYKDNQSALTLRSLNMLLEALRKEGSMILVPSEVPHLMNNATSAAIARHEGSIQNK